MHHGGVQFDDAVLVGQSAVADRQFFRIILDDGDSLDDRFERVDSLGEKFIRPCGSLNAVG